MTIDKCLKLKGNELEQVEFNKPELTKSSDVLIEVLRAGVCGTDLHILEGIFGANQGVIMGHECVGKVAEVGAEVVSCKIGDIVVVNPHGSCGDCYYCNRRCPHFCMKKALDASLGMRRDGAFAPYTIAPGESCYLLPSNVTLEDAILVEPYSCIMHAIGQGSPLEEDQDILVMGAGIIGLLATILLASKNIRNITVIELSDHRRETVEKMGLKGVRAVHPKTISEEKEAADGDPTYGYDRAFDFTGAVPAIQTGFDNLRKKGKLVLFGVMKEGAECKLHLHDILYKEVEITGALTNPGSLQPALDAIADLSAKKMLDLEFLDIRTFALDDFKEAFDKLKKGTIAKAMFDLTK